MVACKLGKVFGCFVVFVCLVSFLFVGLVQAASTPTAITVGGTPYDLAITPDGAYVYVPNGDDVVVIDTSTKTVVERIAVGVDPFGVAISPDGQHVYVINRNSDNGGSVSVINVADNSVSSTVMVGGDPKSVVVSPDGQYIYVLKSELVDVGGGYYESFGMVSVISAATNSVLSDVSVGRYPQSLMVSPAGDYLYVTSVGGVLYVVDTSFKADTVNIKIGDVGLGDMVVSSDGEYVYVLSIEEVFVVSTKSNTVVATISELEASSGGAVSPDGKYVYVTEHWSNNVSAINTATYLVEFSIGAGVAPYGVEVSPDGKYLYVSNIDYTTTDSYSVNYVGKISVVNTDPNAVVFGSSTLQLLIILVVCVVVVVVAVLVIMRIRHKPKPSSLVVDSSVKDNAVAESCYSCKTIFLPFREGVGYGVGTQGV